MKLVHLASCLEQISITRVKNMEFYNRNLWIRWILRFIYVPQANKLHMSSRMWNFTKLIYRSDGLRFTKIYTAAHKMYSLL